MISEASRGRYDFDKPENITNLYRQSNRTNWKKRRHQELSETTRVGLKAQDQASCRVLSPILWHKIRWYPLKMEKFVFQTNGIKELKTQGAKCQGLLWLPRRLLVLVYTENFDTNSGQI